jgi:tRNA dimethylallyltransferase
MNSLDLFLNSFFDRGFLSQKRAYILFGPTATGKTNFAIRLAKKIDAEIINCDMAQIYSEIKVGVGQIKEEEKEGVVHYLFGFLTEPSLFSVYQMRIEIELKIAFILSKNKNVLIVGGSSFCVYSLFFAPSLFYKNSNCVFSEQIEKNYNKSIVSVFSGSAEDKKKKDSIVFFPKYDYVVIFIDIVLSSRFVWFEHIKSRIEQFFSNGWIEEIEKMNQSWIDFLLRKKFIGYVELIDYITNKKDILHLNEVKEIIFFRTCQYGKKQRTFLRKMKRDFLKYDVLCLENNFTL